MSETLELWAAVEETACEGGSGRERAGGGLAAKVSKQQC